MAKQRGIKFNRALEVGLRRLLNPPDYEEKIKALEIKIAKLETRTYENSVKIRLIKGTI